MTSGIRIPISGDVSGLNTAMDSFHQKARKVFNDLNGDAQIDTSAALQSLEELAQAAKNVHSELGKASSGDISNKSLQAMLEALEKAAEGAKALEQAAGNAGGKSGSSYAKTTAEVRKLAAEMERANRLKERMAKLGHNMTTGQAAELGKDFTFWRDNNASPAMRKKLQQFGGLDSLAGGGWRNLGSNEMASRRQFNDILRQLGMGAPGGAPGAAGGANQQVQRSFANMIAQSFKRAGAGILHAATPGAGVGGQIAGNAMTEAAGSSGGLLSLGGAARMAGGLGVGALAYGAVKAIGAVGKKVDSSEEESIRYADVQRQMGDTSVSFDELRDAVRASAKNLDMNFGDGAKMWAAYQKNAGIDGMSSSDIYGEMSSAGGFARALGQDPDAGGQLMSSMRYAKVSTGDSDNKRFALMIGESVARAGVFTKADDVMSAVAGFTMQATRASLSPANTEGYISGLTNLMSLKLAGLDPSASAEMLGKADGAIRSNQGEAQRAMRLGLYQRAASGMNAVDADIVASGGAMGSIASAFGEDAPAMQAAKANGDTALVEKYRRMAKEGGTTTNLDREVGEFSKMGTDRWRMQLQGAYGYSPEQANAMIAAYKKNGSVTEASHQIGKKYDLDMKTMNAGSIRNLIEIDNADGAQLGKKADWLRTQNLSEGEKSQLAAAQASPGENMHELRKVMIELASKRGMEMSEGDVSRKNMASLDNMATDIATKLIPMTNAIREGITWMAKRVGYTDKFGDSQKAKEELAARLNNAPDAKARRDMINQEVEKVDAAPSDYTPEYRKELAARQAEAVVKAPNVGLTGPGNEGPIRSTTGKLRGRSAEVVSLVAKPSPYDDLFKKAAAKHGVNWLDLKQIAAQESSLKPNDINRNAPDGKRPESFDRGIMQLNSRFDSDWGVTDETVMDPETNIMAGAKNWASLLKRNNNSKYHAFMRYNGDGEKARKYADRAMAINQHIHPNDGGKEALADAGAVLGNIKKSIFGGDRAPAKVSAAKVAAAKVVPAPAAAPAAVAGQAPDAGADFSAFMRRMFKSMKGDAPAALASDEYGQKAIPPGATPAQIKEQAIKLTGGVDVHVLDPRGRPIAPPAHVAAVAAPAVAGRRQ